MRRVYWSGDELQLLYDTIHDADWFAKVKPFIDRSPIAIRRRMCQLREESGIVPVKLGPKATGHARQVQAQYASRRLLGLARAATGHIPFPGFRTQEEVNRDQTEITRAVLSSAFPAEPRKAMFTPPKPDRTWCYQCERLVKCQEAGVCPSQWCKAKEMAA